jgi:hypothetical protein
MKWIALKGHFTGPDLSDHAYRSRSSMVHWGLGRRLGRMRWRAVPFCIAALAVACALLVPPAQAQRGPQGHDFHGRDFGHFSPGELRGWRNGAWRHEWHDGRYAWWWVTDGYWYFYPVPIYPYPTYVPPAIIMQQAPPVPTGLPPAQFWYFCDNPQGYYPYVASCNTPWREVPATPPK